MLANYSLTELTFDHINENLNAKGPNRCSFDSECDGARTCSAYGNCQGSSGLPFHTQTLAEEAKNRDGTLISNGSAGTVNIRLANISAHTFADGSQIVRKNDGSYYIINGGAVHYVGLLIL